MDTTIKIFRILTIASYFLININGEHFGGPMILFLLFWLSDGKTWTVLGTLLLLLSAIFSIYFALKPLYWRDKYLIPFLYLILLSPFLIYYKQTFRNLNWINGSMFFITLTLFILLCIASTVLILTRPKIINR